ncbi:hypothetical protein [Leptospira licerasiae]|uniref:Uncharacterized protein n=1 Tax=Leptospira licerasiae str. MMD4847 TaxID=1049971 RepID=A0ABN0H876_9LEPT|nr:hypothetical protein [Leptospira licerasiae]EID99686.1 hypothetical protein LEP1GSC185_0587 [Leptospira licerasiae serovar Varillal str. VAR 010]EJZ41480.1 hypothetical protein LEP1GSC178_3955 [Leptospira licerasiae str. MMD4847]
MLYKKCIYHLRIVFIFVLSLAMLINFSFAKQNVQKEKYATEIEFEDWNETRDDILESESHQLHTPFLLSLHNVQIPNSELLSSSVIGTLSSSEYFFLLAASLVSIPPPLL